MSRLLEEGGAQVLPRNRDERATVSAWAAAEAVSADLRHKSPAHASLAGELRVIA